MSNCPSDIVSGSTKPYLQEWEKLTSDPIILQNVQGIRIQFDEKPHQAFLPRQYRFNDAHADVIVSEIEELLAKKVIVRIFDIRDCFISNIFLRPKPNGKFRMIVDLSLLNESVSKNHFKMDHLDVATDLMFPNAWFTSIDLTEAYYSLPIHEDDQKYLVFQWDSKFYKFTCLPFGLCSAPWVFSKTLKPIFSKFHEQGFSGFGYIDDSFIIADSYEEAIKSTEFLCKTFKKLGFRINENKSVFIPSHEIVFLGYKLNSTDMSVTPTAEKVEKIEGKISSVRQHKKVKIRQVASLLGSLNDVCKASEYGKAYVKLLEIEKIRALTFAGKKQFEGFMKISHEANTDLQWWLQNLESQKRILRVSPPDLTISCDASNSGWGACFDKDSTGGRWSLQEEHFHINVLELKAVELGLLSLCSHLENVGLKILSDNTTAVAYLCNGGGTRSVECNQVAKRIWSWGESKNIWFMPGHIPGSQNVQADFESRHFSEDTEWKLNVQLFHEITAHFGLPEIDLFASRNNFQISPYVSWCPDPGALFVDAFTGRWSQFEFIYVFPPFRLLNRVVQKIQHERVDSVVVAPNWPGQPWHAPLQRLAKQVLQFPRKKNNLIRMDIRPFRGKSVDDIPLNVYLLSFEN